MPKLTTHFFNFWRGPITIIVNYRMKIVNKFNITTKSLVIVKRGCDLAVRTLEVRKKALLSLKSLQRKTK